MAKKVFFNSLKDPKLAAERAVISEFELEFQLNHYKCNYFAVVNYGNYQRLYVSKELKK